jgi:hypothetical protein
LDGLQDLHQLDDLLIDAALLKWESRKSEAIKANFKSNVNDPNHANI